MESCHYTIVKIILGDDRQLGLAVVFIGAEFLPELFRAGKIVQGNGGFQIFQIGFIVEDKTITIGGKGEWDIQQPGIIKPLLHPLADLMLV